MGNLWAEERLKMRIFKEDGYIDFDSVTSQATFVFMILARGTGKTFGALKWAIDSGSNFIYMRRTQTQLDMIKNPMLNPFKALERVLGEDYSFSIKPVSKGITGIYQNIGTEQRRRGFIMALSTISNVRGFDASDCDIMIYDEFIGEKHEKPVRMEGMAFLNAIETCSRNRELEGKKPMKVLCLANSNDLANPLFVELGLVKYAERIIRKKTDFAIIPDRDICLVISGKSPISEQKAKTSLYRMAGDSAFTQMAIENEFSQEFTEQVRSMSLKGFKPLVAVGEIVIYSHKSEMLYYVTDHMSGHPEKYGSAEVDLKRFAEHYYWLKISYFNRHVFFESYILQVLFEKYLSL